MGCSRLARAPRRSALRELPRTRERPLLSGMSGKPRGRVKLARVERHPLAPHALVLLLVAPLVSGAQQDSVPRPAPADSARVVGAVRSARNGLPLQGVTISVRGTHHFDVSDSAGAFAVSDVPSGNQIVRIVYGDTLSYEKAFHFTRRQTLVLAVVLDAQAVDLTPVVVEASSLLADLSLAGFYERRRTAVGRFYTYDQLEQAVPRSLRVLLIQAGVTMQCLRGRCLPLGTNSSRACVLSLYADAVPIQADEIEAFHPDELAAVEVYRRAVDIPFQFRRRYDDCGAILMWRRR